MTPPFRTRPFRLATTRVKAQRVDRSAARVERGVPGSHIVAPIAEGLMISDLQDPRILSERLHLALAAARLGSWELRLPERSLEASAQCLANHGLSPDARLDLPALGEAIEPGERQRFLDTVDGAIGTLGSFEIEVPNRWPDG